MARNLIVEHPQFGDVRAVIDPVTLHDHELRGYVAVGACSNPHRQPLLTDTEQAAYDASEAERVAALLKSDVASASSRPSK